MIEEFKRMKWLPYMAGVMMCVLGGAALLFPDQVAKLLHLCLGVGILGLGVCELAAGFAGRGDAPAYIVSIRRLHGVVNVAVGLVFLLNRTLSVLFAAVALGVWACAFGLIRLLDALHRRLRGAAWGGCAADAAVKFLLGVCMLASPWRSLRIWMILLGVFFVVVGISVICSARFLDRLPHDFADF